MRHIVVGVDGGGSKTHVIVAETGGKQLAEVLGPGSATAPERAAHSASVIATAVRAALAQADIHETPRVLYAGVAGVGRVEEYRALLEELHRLDLADEVTLVGDGEIALADAFGNGPGIMLIAGTGSIAHGRSPGGSTARCGGWGSAFGDEGSGAWIGRRALGMVAAAADGREPETALAGAILTATQLNAPEELIRWAGAATPRDLAQLAPVVFATAAAGDIRANSLVALAAEELVLHVRALATRLFGDERSTIPLALSGGLLQKGSLLKKRVEQRLRSAVPGAQLKPGEIIAARGAAKAALAALEGEWLPADRLA